MEQRTISSLYSCGSSIRIADPHSSRTSCTPASNFFIIVAAPPNLYVIARFHFNYRRCLWSLNTKSLYLSRVLKFGVSDDTFVVEIAGEVFRSGHSWRGYALEILLPSQDLRSVHWDIVRHLPWNVEKLGKIWRDYSDWTYSWQGKNPEYHVIWPTLSDAGLFWSHVQVWMEGLSFGICDEIVLLRSNWWGLLGPFSSVEGHARDAQSLCAIDLFIYLWTGGLDFLLVHGLFYLLETFIFLQRNAWCTNCEEGGHDYV